MINFGHSWSCCFGQVSENIGDCVLSCLRYVFANPKSRLSNNKCYKQYIYCKYIGDYEDVHPLNILDKFWIKVAYKCSCGPFLMWDSRHNVEKVTGGLGISLCDYLWLSTLFHGRCNHKNWIDIQIEKRSSCVKPHKVSNKVHATEHRCPETLFWGINVFAYCEKGLWRLEGKICQM